MHSQDIGMKFGIEKCAMLIMQTLRCLIIEQRELSNQEKIRMHREKEIYKYLGILQADTIKHKEMKKKKKPRKTRKLLKPNYLAEISPKGFSFCKILGTIFKVDEGRTSTNEAENKKTHNDA